MGQVQKEAIRGATPVEEEIDEAVRNPKIARRPHTPTKAEVVAHMTLHAEYRDWCPTVSMVVALAIITRVR